MNYSASVYYSAVVYYSAYMYYSANMYNSAILHYRVIMYYSAGMYYSAITNYNAGKYSTAFMHYSVDRATICVMVLSFQWRFFRICKWSIHLVYSGRVVCVSCCAILIGLTRTFVVQPSSVKITKKRNLSLVS